MALLATVLTVSGIALLFLAQWDRWAWLTSLPVVDIGSALFTTGLVVVAFEYIDSQDADTRANQRLRTVFAEQAPVLREAVIDGLATNPNTLMQIASPQVLDRVIENCLTARLGDAQLADDVYTDLRRQVVQATGRRYDAHVSVNLTPWEKGPRTGRGSMFVATLRWDYHTRELPSVLRFYAVADHTQYRQLLRDPESAGVWLFEPTVGLDITTPDVYQLAQCTINGQPQPIEHHHRDDARLFTVDTSGEPAGESGDYHVSFTERTLVSQHGHLLFLDFDKPTRGLDVEFTYGGCGIRHVSMLDFITSAQQPRVNRSPDTIPTPTISIGFDGWTFPRSGIAFTWVLDREVARQHVREGSDDSRSSSGAPRSDVAPAQAPPDVPR